MNIKKAAVLPVLAILCVSAAHPQSPDITGEFDITPEYNRSFYQCLSFSASARADFNGGWNLKTGFQFGILGGGLPMNYYDIDIFFSGEYKIPVKFPLYVETAYIFNMMPDISGVQTHSLVPMITVKNNIAGMSLGVTSRFNIIYDEFIYENKFAYRIFCNFINNTYVLLGFSIANFDDFTAGNNGSAFLSLDNVVHINKRTGFRNSLRIMQAGNTSLAANFYGLSYSTGVIVSW